MPKKKRTGFNAPGLYSTATSCWLAGNCHRAETGRHLNHGRSGGHPPWQPVPVPGDTDQGRTGLIEINPEPDTFLRSCFRRTTRPCNAAVAPALAPGMASPNPSGGPTGARESKESTKPRFGSELASHARPASNGESSGPFQ